MDILVVESKELSRFDNVRYVIVDSDSGELLDDAQGYGYKSKKKAYAAWAYKTRDKSKDKEKQEKIHRIKRWMKSHKGFMNTIAQYAFEIEVKGSWSPEDKVDENFIQDCLDQYGYIVEFDLKDFLKVWRS